VNPDRPKWLPNNWTFETKVRTDGASVGQKDRYYFESVTRSKFRSKPQVDDFLKTGLKSKKLDPNCDAVHYPRVKNRRTVDRKRKRRMLINCVN